MTRCVVYLSLYHLAVKYHRKTIPGCDFHRAPLSHLALNNRAKLNMQYAFRRLNFHIILTTSCHPTMLLIGCVLHVVHTTIR